MQNTSGNKQGFSIIVAVFMIGFLLVLTTGVFNLVLREMKDSRGAENSLKAYAAAEGAMELGLLNIKNQGFATDVDLMNTDNTAQSLTFTGAFKAQSDPLISYQTDIAVDSFSGTLESGETVIIPLFVNGIGIEKPNLATSSDIIWNIIGSGEGLSGDGDFLYSEAFTFKQNKGAATALDTYVTKSIEQFLGRVLPAQSVDNRNSYLMLFNKGLGNESYLLDSISGDNFSKPVGNITSSVTVGKFRQSISTSIDNTEFLNMLKYSVFNNGL